MVSQCVDAVENRMLEQLREEGCRLIQWSDDLKNQLPGHPGMVKLAGQSPSGGDMPSGVDFLKNSANKRAQVPSGGELSANGNLHLGNGGLNALTNRGPCAAGSLVTQLPSGLSAQLRGPPAGQPEQQPSQRLLTILYNNYKFILKKYEELHEQKLSYVEGIREFQHRLDNANYLIQLQRAQLNSLAGASADSRHAEPALATGWLSKQQHLLERERELLQAREQELDSREQLVKSREESLGPRESELSAKLEDLGAREQLLASREAALSERESAVSSRESALSQRQLLLDAREAELAALDELLRARQAALPQSPELPAEAQPSSAAHDSAPSPSEPSHNKSIVVEERGEILFKTAGPADSPKGVHCSDEEIDNEAIDSAYIQSMNASNDNMFVLKKNVFNRVALRKFTMRVEGDCLEFDIKSNPFKLPLKEISRVHFGEESHSFKISAKRAGSDEAWKYFTIYTHSKKNINVYCENEHNVRTWRTGLNRILLKQAARELIGAEPASPAKQASGPAATVSAPRSPPSDPHSAHEAGSGPAGGDPDPVPRPDARPAVPAEKSAMKGPYVDSLDRTGSTALYKATNHNQILNPL